MNSSIRNAIKSYFTYAFLNYVSYISTCIEYIHAYSSTALDVKGCVLETVLYGRFKASFQG